MLKETKLITGKELLGTLDELLNYFNYVKPANLRGNADEKIGNCYNLSDEHSIFNQLKFIVDNHTFAFHKSTGLITYFEIKAFNKKKNTVTIATPTFLVCILKEDAEKSTLKSS